MNIFKSLLAILPFIRQKTLFLRKKAKAVGKKLRKRVRGLAGDPISYLGLFSVILLSGIFIFLPDFSIKSLTTWDFSFLPREDSNSVSAKNLFADPVKNILKETPEMNFIGQNSALGFVPPVIGSSQVLGSIIGVGDEENDVKTIKEYSVESGDTLSSIAQKFSISSNTILWANSLAKSSDIKVGQKLIIPPVDGLIYHVKKGDTLSDIANTYKAQTSDIVDFNELSGEEDIYIGDILVIPGGKMPAGKPVYATAAQTPIASSYFICPNTSCRITQRLHWYNAIDFAGDCGSPVVASAGGAVQKVRYGWNGGAGNTISILHPNGVITTYGHISTSLVSVGQQVLQGQMIALIGGKPGMPGSGISTGCHVHFQVIGARNPFAN